MSTPTTTNTNGNNVDETSSLLGHNNINGGGNRSSSNTTSKSNTTSTTTTQTTTTKEGHRSIWSKLVFQWFTPLLYKGNEQGMLSIDDIDLVEFPNDCTTNEITTIFHYYWSQEQTTKTTPSLVRALCYSFGKEYMYAAALKLIHDICIFVGPQVLHRMIVYLRDPTATIQTGIVLTVAVTISQIMVSLCLRHYFFKCYITGLKIRTALSAAIYHKALVVSTEERYQRTVGEITNLMSIDTQRLQDLTTYLNSIWSSPFQIILALYFLYNEMGISSAGGVAVIVLMIPVTKTVSKWMGNMQKKVMKARDNRVDSNTEILSNMKITKYQAWENPFRTKIMDLRTMELRQLFIYYIGGSFSRTLWVFTPLAVAVATFSVYVVLGNQLDVATALTALALFDILRFPLFMLPQIINNLVESYISLQRVQSFLLGSEHIPIGPGSLTETGIVLDHISATYGIPKANNNTTTAVTTTTNDKTNKKKETKATDEATAKELAKKQWELSLLQAQLDEAELLIKKYTNKPAANGTSSSTQRNYGTQLSSDTINSTGTVAVADTEGGAAMSSSSSHTNNILCLKRITMECKPGEFIVIVGGVGCGKTSLVNTILGEVTTVAGTIAVHGKLAYFSQSPFIMNATVRDNILFGHASDHDIIDEGLYQRAITCCALQHDLQLLPNGDETEIGEKGITLSGGQKARIALARAVYHRADITVIDDALSAVDAHVAKHIFEQAFVNELLSNSTTTSTESTTSQRSVVLVTNALQYLNHPRVNKIVVIQDGRIVEQGTYNDLVSNASSVFSRYISVIDKTSGSMSDSTSKSDLATIEPSDMEPTKEETTVAAVANSTTTVNKVRRKAGSKLMTEETRETGHVGKDVYLTWARAAGGIFVPIIFIVVFAIVEGISILSNWWITYWSAHGATSGKSQAYYLAIYATINVTVALAGLCRMIFVSFFGLRASGKLFSEMLDVVLHAKMSFYDTTPVGRLINRFSKDIYTTDERLTETMRTYLATLFNVLSTIVVISGVTPIFTLCLIPIIGYYLVEQAFFTLTYRELKRIDSVTRSPIYALLGESVDGAAVIRAFGAQETLSKRLMTILDKQQHAYFLTCTAQSWLAVRLELIANLIVAFACSSAVLQHATAGSDPTFAGLAGLAISYSLSATQSLNWSVRMASDLEAAMVSVERIQEYTKLENEGARETKVDEELKDTWPGAGKIEFQGAKLRYRPELPLVLKGLDLIIPGGSKVGVVGRTGAGKSTLMVALMRIVELSEGRILIDDVDTQTLGLSNLRGSIAVIPQDPVLFSGTVRTNLDPFNDHSDTSLLDALEQVGLYKPVSTKPLSSDSLTSMANARIDSLENSISEGGSNFSVGQRQLLVIARALLRGTKIVIMDEATAAIDAETDAAIQKVLRSVFASATCITVAHRLNTIMDSDYILVMDDGKAAEFDTPNNLLQRGGMFRDLVQAAAH